MSTITKIVLAATPTSPLLTHLVHAFQHKPNLEITVLTRETSISLSSQPVPSHHHDHEHTHDHAHPTTNGHKHESHVSHIHTSFTPLDLTPHLQNASILILALTGSDLHLSSPIIEAATSIPSINLIIPSEFGLDTSNPSIRSLLPPYKTRYEIQEKLRASGKKWKAIYTGIALEDGLKTDGVLGIDCLWGSVVVFPGNEEREVAVSRWEDVAGIVVSNVFVDEAVEKRNEVYACGFQAKIGDIVGVVEKGLERDFDRYEGVIEGAKKEAKERMAHGYFDGGVALMGRVAAWDPRVDAWSAWKGTQGRWQSSWEDRVVKIAKAVRQGKIGGDGCGC